MAVNDNQLIISESITANTTSASVSLPGGTSTHVGYVNTSAYVGVTAVDVTIQHSLDKSTWSTLQVMTQVTSGSPTALNAIAGTVYGNVRAVVTLTGAGSVNVDVKVWYDPGKA